MNKWTSDPNKILRDYPDGTAFLLRRSSGSVDQWALYGNIPNDERLKMRRNRDGAIQYVPRYIGTMFALL